MEIQKGAKIGFLRIDYGSKGFRRAVPSAGYDEFGKKVHLFLWRPHFEKATREMRMHTKNLLKKKEKIKKKNVRIKALNKKKKKQLSFLLAGERLVVRNRQPRKNF